MLSADERKLRIRAMTTTAKARLQWYDRVYRLCCQLAGNSYVVDSDDEENRDARRLAVAFTQLDSVWSLACVLRSEEIAEVESAMDGLRLA